MSNTDHRYLCDVLIEYESKKLRFWLPEDRPFEQIVEALVQAAPFESPLPKGTYKLYRQDPKWGNYVPLDDKQTIFLSRIQPGASLKLALLERTSRTAFLVFEQAAPDGTNSIELGRVTLIGRGTETSKPGIDFIDLTDFARSPADLSKISREHAKIAVDPEKGDYWLSVSDNPHGTRVNGKPIKYGDRVKLEHGAKLSFVNVGATIEIFDDEGEDEGGAG